MLVTKLANGLDLRMQHEVKKICYRPEQVRVFTNQVIVLAISLSNYYRGILMPTKYYVPSPWVY